MDKVIAKFQVSVHIKGDFGQELLILVQVSIPEFESYILEHPACDEILLNRAKSKINDCVNAGQLHGKILDKTNPTHQETK